MRAAVAILLVTGSCAPPRIPERLPPAPVPAPSPPPTVTPVPPQRPPAEGTIPVGAAGRLWYRIVGDAPDTAVIPLGAWLQQALTPLTDRYTLVFYDPRGRGRSDPVSDTAHIGFEADVEDLETVRRTLGVSRAAVIGYHLHGAVAAAYAARHPGRVSRLVLLGVIEPTDSLELAYSPPDRATRLDTADARQLVRMRAAGRDTSDLAAYCRAFWRVNAPVFVGDTALSGRLIPDWCELPNESPARLAPQLARRFASLGPLRNLAPVAAGVSVPALVVHGTRDLVVSPDGARAWAERLPQGRLWLLPGVGHLSFLEAPELLLRGLRQFLAGEWPVGALPVRPP